MNDKTEQLAYFALGLEASCFDSQVRGNRLVEILTKAFDSSIPGMSKEDITAVYIALCQGSLNFDGFLATDDDTKTKELLTFQSGLNTACIGRAIKISEIIKEMSK